MCVCTGTLVVTLSATDSDASWPNNAVSYVIESGSRDDFVINPLSGLLTVSSTAQLTRSPTRLTVAAVDAGCPTLKSVCQVDISVIDLDARAPQFHTTDGLILVTSVAEDAPVGHVVYTCVAVNAAGSQTVTFHWLNESHAARGYDVRGQLVSNQSYVKVRHRMGLHVTV